MSIDWWLHGLATSGRRHGDNSPLTLSSRHLLLLGLIWHGHGVHGEGLRGTGTHHVSLVLPTILLGQGHLSHILVPLLLICTTTTTTTTVGVVIIVVWLLVIAVVSVVVSVIVHLLAIVVVVVAVVLLVAIDHVATARAPLIVISLS